MNITTKLTLSFCLIFYSYSTISAKTVTLHVETSTPIINYGESQLSKALEDNGHSLKRSGNSNADINLSFHETEQKSTESYQIIKHNHQIKIQGNGERGAMYGMLDLVHHIQMNGDLSDFHSKTVEPRFPFRAIKFNLPWMSYRKGEALQLHMETCRDLEYWESFLDMMAANRFNVLSLWNLHPFTFMIRPKNFPEACGFSDSELAEWQTFWHTLFRMAKERGIDTYVVNWNIFVSPEFAEEYNVADFSKDWDYYGEADRSELVERYTRECVTQTLNEYPNLTGIGITLGERMGGMTAEERRNWLNRTIIQGMKDADRPVKFLHRAPLSAGKGSGGSTSKTAEQITREVIEKLPFDQPIWVSFKYNWSHGHSSPKLHIVHGGELTDTYWNPTPNNYKIIWTIRNEDFFVLRWGNPDFIREFIEHNGKDYMGGCIIGSECYIPAKDYIHKYNDHQTWRYAFERQWLFYSLWGKLLFDPETPNEWFAMELDQVFGKKNLGNDLLQAWTLASKTPHHMASFHRGTWDATLYTEGFTEWENGKSTFIDLNSFINHPVLDPQYVSISEYVKNESRISKERITPIELAEQLESNSDHSLGIITRIRDTNELSPRQECELLDIESWCWYGFYFAKKLRGAVALERFRQTGDKSHKTASVEELVIARSYWNKLAETIHSHNKKEIPYVFNEHFSWQANQNQVQSDIEIAKNAGVEN